jgi:homocysteine S-methyltransferase
VFDVDAIGLTNMVSRLNRGLDIGGQPVGAPTRFHVGVGFNPFAPSPDEEWRRLMHKVEAGAEFVVTPPIFDTEAFAPVLDRLEAAGLPVLAGLGRARRIAARGVPRQRGRGREDSRSTVRSAA